MTRVFCKTISSIMSVEKNCAVPETFKTVFLKCYFHTFHGFCPQTACQSMGRLFPKVAAHGCLLRGPLDGVLAVASLQRALTSGSPPQLVRSLGYASSIY